MFDGKPGAGAEAGMVFDRFDTSGVAPRERHEAWAHRDWPSMAPLYRTVPQEPFDVRSERLRLGEVVVQYVRVTGQEWIRDGAVLRSWDPDHLMVAITLEGRAAGTLGRRGFATKAGDLHLVSLARPSAHISTASRTIILAIPRRMAADRGIDVEAVHGAVLNGTMSGLLTSHLLTVRDGAARTAAASAPLIGRSAVDLLALALTDSGRVAQGAPVGREGALVAARALIERELGSDALGGRLSRTLGISRSTLHRLFAEHGGVQAYVRDRRLEAVRRALLDPACVEGIAILADRFGFSDAAHLSRLFRSRYGMTPSECRGEAQMEARRPRPD
jgi:AraC-like DNA-binding protein